MNLVTQREGDEQEYGIIHIKKNKLELLEGKYNEMAQRAHVDQSYLSDYLAAYLAPAKFMNNPSGFEATFDTILFHSNAAYKKSSSDDERIIVSRTIEDVFSQLLIVLQEKIRYAKQSSTKKFLNNIFSVIRGIQENFFKVLDDVNEVSKDLYHNQGKNIGVVDILKMTPEGQVLFSIGPEVANITEAFVTYLFERWEIKKNEEYFNKQLLNVFEKVLNAVCYNDYGLIRNCFLRVKEDVLEYAYYSKGMNACLNLSKFDFNINEKNDTNRIIVSLLIENQEWEFPYDYLEHLNKPEYSRLVDILGWFYVSCKEEILTYTVSKYGLDEALKLTSYDNDIHDINRIIINVLIKSRSWGLAYDYLEYINNADFSQLIDIIRGLYALKKKQILTFTISRYGETEALKLALYDNDKKSVNDTTLTILSILAKKGKWEETIAFIADIKINNKIIYDRALKITIDIYAEYARKISINKKGNVNFKKAKELIKQFELKLKSFDEYETYMVKFRKGQKIEKRILHLAIIGVCIIFIAFQIYRYDSYRENRYNEVKRIEMVEKQAELILNDNKLSEALSIIKSELFWDKTSFPFSLRDKKQVSIKKEKLLMELINKSCRLISEEVNNELDNQNYEYIYLNYVQALTSSVDLLSKKKQKESMLAISQYLSKVNTARHAYLVITLDEIKRLVALGEKQEAIKLTSILYHYSEDKFKSAFIGFGSVTFKEYWDNKRKETVKKIK